MHLGEHIFPSIVSHKCHIKKNTFLPHNRNIMLTGKERIGYGFFKQFINQNETAVNIDFSYIGLINICKFTIIELL